MYVKIINISTRKKKEEEAEKESWKAGKPGKLEESWKAGKPEKASGLWTRKARESKSRSALVQECQTGRRRRKKEKLQPETRYYIVIEFYPNRIKQ